MAEHSYSIFETAGGFCGIAWNANGITRFQLPTQAADATEKLLLKRLAQAAVAATPSAEIEKVIADIRRYFAGEKSISAR